MLLFRNKLNVAIALLVITAVGLSLLAFNRSGFNFLPKNDTSLPGGQSSTPSTSPGARIGTTPNAQEKEALLKFPTSESSDEDRQNYFSLVNKFAVSTDKVEFNEVCEPTPFVMAVSKDEAFSLKNNGQEGIVINIDEQHSYSIPPGQSVSAKADLVNGPGIHGIFCSKANDKAVGVLLSE